MAQDVCVCREREGRREVPLSVSVGNGATETEEALTMRLALWLRCVFGGHQRDCKLGPFVQEVLSYRDHCGGWGCITH